jgi:hypothetical protein
LSWDWCWWRSDWRVRERSTGLLTLSCIAVSSNTALIGSTTDLDGSTVTPVGSPRVLDQPVINSIFSSVPVNKNSMVDGLRGAARKDAIGVVSKGSITGIQVRNCCTIGSNLKYSYSKLREHLDSYKNITILPVANLYLKSQSYQITKSVKKETRERKM